MFITLPNKDYKSSDITLAAILACTKKDNMLKVCKKLDLYVSPNLRKDETARRLASEMLETPEAILCVLSKTELKLLDEFVKAGSNAYIARKERKMPYMLQKLGLVVTYEELTATSKGVVTIWHMLMPDEVRTSLADLLPLFLTCVEKGIPTPSYKELRMMSAMAAFLGE